MDPTATQPPVPVSRAARTFGVLSVIFGGLTALVGLLRIAMPTVGREWLSLWTKFPRMGRQGEEMANRMGEAYEAMAAADGAQVTVGLLLLLFSPPGRCRRR